MYKKILNFVFKENINIGDNDKNTEQNDKEQIQDGHTKVKSECAKKNMTKRKPNSKKPSMHSTIRTNEGTISTKNDPEMETEGDKINGSKLKLCIC